MPASWVAEDSPLFMSLNGCFSYKDNKKHVGTENVDLPALRSKNMRQIYNGSFLKSYTKPGH